MWSLLYIVVWSVISLGRVVIYYHLILLFLLFFQVINDLLDPTGQNLRIREDAQVLMLIKELTLFFCAWLFLFFFNSTIALERSFPFWLGFLHVFFSLSKVLNWHTGNFVCYKCNNVYDSKRTRKYEYSTGKISFFTWSWHEYGLWPPRRFKPT